jgi:hypothetical protein
MQDLYIKTPDKETFIKHMKVANVDLSGWTEGDYYENDDVVGDWLGVIDEVDTMPRVNLRIKKTLFYKEIRLIMEDGSELVIPPKEITEEDITTLFAYVQSSVRLNPEKPIRIFM